MDKKKAQPELLLKKRYQQEIVGTLLKDFKLRSVMQSPRIEKVCINMGLGEAVQNASVVDKATDELQRITGQKPRINRAKKSIAAFKLREGVIIGASVTMRGRRMWEFLERLLFLALPQVRDFRGLPRKSFDGRGNYTFGIKEQIIFPEISYDSIDALRGMNITITTTAPNDEQGFRLLELLGVPFRRR